MAIYYISATGNDNNNGTTIDTPWQTLTKVNAATFTAGDSILFNKGDTFYGSIIINQPGTSGNPITFSSYGTGVNPIITGFTDVIAWTDLGNSIWESTSAVSTLSTCNMVTIGGVNTAMGRYPNGNATNEGYLNIDSHNGSTSITCNALTGSWVGAEVVIRNTRYTLCKGTITSQSGTTLFHNSGFTPSDNYGFFIQNAALTLDQQNEWYFDSSTKKIRIFSTTQPTNVKIASVTNLIKFGYNQYNQSLTSYIIIENINFTGANSDAIWGWNHLSAGYRLNDVSIQNCNISFSGGSAIFITSSILNVIGNTISESSASAINAFGCGTTNVKNNSITNTALIKGAERNYDDLGINCQGMTGVTDIEGNSIINSGFNGISVGGDSVITVKNNYINTFNVKLDDGGAISTGSGTALTLITGNICINGIGNYAGLPSNEAGNMSVGIYLDANSGNIEVAGNTVANCAWLGIYVHFYTHDSNVHHNIVYNNGTQLRCADDGAHLVNISINNNQFISKLSTQNVCSFSLHVNELATYATSDYNYYCRPISEGNTFDTYQPNTGGVQRSLLSWQTFSGQDTHSLGSPQTLTTVNDFQFEYNATLTTKNVTLTEPMIDVTGTKYVGSITLQPFTSIVMMKDYNPAPSTTKFVITSNNKLIVSNNQVLTEMI